MGAQNGANCPAGHADRDIDSHPTTPNLIVNNLVDPGVSRCEEQGIAHAQQKADDEPGLKSAKCRQRNKSKGNNRKAKQYGLEKSQSRDNPRSSKGDDNDSCELGGSIDSDQGFRVALIT